MKKALLTFVLWGLLGPLDAQVALLEVKARPGDGVLALLRLYRVNNSCNLDYFYKINNMSRKQGLHVDKVYKLPIYRYTYNGVSIRSTLGIPDWERAKAIQEFNEIMYKLNFRKTAYMEDKDLWVPYSQLNCPEAPIDLSEPNPVQEIGGEESTSAARPGIRGTYPIFGKDHEEVHLKGTQLKGCVYYIVSGHGGPDPGAVGKKGKHSLCEDEYAYDVALRLTKSLLEQGATAYLIIRDPDDGIRSGTILPADKDEVCWGDIPIPRGQSDRLAQRSSMVNQLFSENNRKGVPYQRMIVIHVDSEKRNERVDMYFYHRQDDDVSKDFCTTLQQTIKTKYDTYQKGRGYNGTVSARDLHMLRETLPVVTFIELGNIRNPNDQNRLVLESNRQLIAEWLMDGLLQDRAKYNLE